MKFLRWIVKIIGGYMALHDADKSSDNRITPGLNSDDGVASRMSHNTYGNTYRDAGGAVGQFMAFQQGEINATDSDGKKSVYFGYNPSLSSRPVLRISKAGFDAETAADNELVFNSSNNVFKIVLSGTGTFPATSVSTAGSGATSDTKENTFAHGLGYTPAFLAYMEFGGARILVPATQTQLVGGGGSNKSILFKEWVVSVDSVNITFQASSKLIADDARSGGTPEVGCRYYLMVETAT